jgi:hypothetical protein
LIVNDRPMHVSFCVPRLRSRSFGNSEHQRLAQNTIATHLSFLVGSTGIVFLSLYVRKETYYAIFSSPPLFQRSRLIFTCRRSKLVNQRLGVKVSSSKGCETRTLQLESKKLITTRYLHHKIDHDESRRVYKRCRFLYVLDHEVGCWARTR